MRSVAFVTASIFVMMLFASSAAFSQKIKYYSAPGISFGNYKTYKWRRAEKGQYPERAVDDMFIRVIDGEMAKKGMTLTDSEDADLFVTYQIAVIEDMEWSAGHSTIPWQGMAGVPGLQGGVVSGTNVIKKGWLIIDLYDGKLRRQVWEAQAAKTLAGTPDPQKRESNAKKVIGKIFSKFPPGSN